MPYVHYKFSIDGRPTNLCRQPGTERTDHTSVVTCEECKRELYLRGWRKEFKIHFLKGDSQILCTCTTLALARQRKTLTQDPNEVTCQVCRQFLRRKKVPLRKKEPPTRRTVWDVLNLDDSLFSEV